MRTISNPGSKLFTHSRLFATTAPQTERTRRPAYWQTIPRWSDVCERQFLDYGWQQANIIDERKISQFLEEAVPSTVSSSTLNGTLTRQELLEDITAGMREAPMSIRLTPHILSIINWRAPLQDPIFRQFISVGSTLRKDHPKLSLDSLHESADSPMSGLVHRYPDRVLLLTTAVCPVLCRFCTRSYAVGAPTPSVPKRRIGLTRQSWERNLAYIESNIDVQDVVISGGDTFYLHPKHLRSIGERLLSIPHVKRFRFASKGLAVFPSRFLDPSDGWASTLIDLSRQGRAIGKDVALHTHFNHPREIAWTTRLAGQRLFRDGVNVRNQTVLLRGVNDELKTMSALIRRLSDINIRPMYVYQSDMVKGIEDMRTPLSTALDLESKLRGTIAGHMMPQFVVDLPRGGGKRLVTSFESYDRDTGVSTWRAPGVKQGQAFYYYDPLWKDKADQFAGSDDDHQVEVSEPNAMRD